MGRISRLSLFACIALVMIVAGCSRAGVPGLSVYLRTNADALDRPASVGSQPAKFTVAPGTPARVIAQDLEAAGLIRDALLFEAYVRISNLDSQLEAGVFVLDPSMTPREIAETLQHAQAAAVTLTIPEGWRVGQMADYMSEAGIFSDPEQSDLYRRMTGAGRI